MDGLTSKPCRYRKCRGLRKVRITELAMVDFFRFKDILSLYWAIFKRVGERLEI